MSIEEIPSNELVVMTDFWHRAFNIAGCDPMCHCCYNKIPIDTKFRLATVIPLSKPVYEGHSWSYQQRLKEGHVPKESTTVAPFWEESKEVMLCDKCTAEMFREKELKYWNKEVERISKPPEGGCFRIKGKIVH